MSNRQMNNWNSSLDEWTVAQESLRGILIRFKANRYHRLGNMVVQGPQHPQCGQPVGTIEDLISQDVTLMDSRQHAAMVRVLQTMEGHSFRSYPCTPAQPLCPGIAGTPGAEFINCGKPMLRGMDMCCECMLELHLPKHWL
jgi:hypothetical protein